MRRSPLFGSAALLSGAVAVTAMVAAPAMTPRVHDRVALTSYPTNAAKVFRWGNAQWYDNFIGPVKSMWSVNKPRLVDDQHGMLTINGTSTSGTVSATLTGHGRRYGRWEARVRAQQYSHAATPYKVVWELIPTGAYNCGSRSIVLASYALGRHRAHMSVRHGAIQFTASKRRDLSAGVFHTYAVEVTKTHISWFVDTRVIRTERRSGALTGAMFKVRFRLVGEPGKTMNPGRMQMDWVRYYTLARKNAKSIDAPELNKVGYAQAC
jgi:hypothetical protein